MLGCVMNEDEKNELNTKFSPSKKQTQANSLRETEERCLEGSRGEPVCTSNFEIFKFRRRKIVLLEKTTKSGGINIASFDC